MLNLIDVAPMRPNWGQVWQSGELSALTGRVIPAPHVLFSMIGAVELSPCVSVFMHDNDETVLSDEMLLAMVESAGAYLRRGHNILIHCFEGKYRSTYLDVAVHMAYLKYPYGLALGRVKSQHPIADMRKGTEAQLRRLENVLKELP